MVTSQPEDRSGSPMPPRVVVFGLGGTIAMTATASGGVAPALSAEDLVNTVPGLADTGINVEVVDFRRLPGASLTFADLDELLHALGHSFDDGITGAVIIEGTDPIEEVSYYLDLRHARRSPVIVTGAMRNPAMAGADGPANLLASIITAASLSARDRGVLVVMNDEIHGASRVRKAHSTATSAFQSPNTGPVGFLVEGTPRWLSGPHARQVIPHRPAEYPGTPPRVLLHTIALEDDPQILAGVEDKADGLVVAGMGVGHVPQAFVEPLAKIASHIPVILASRIGHGPSLTSTYGFPGSERDLLSRGLISAGFLDPLKARVLLRTLLASDASPAQIIEAFAAASNTSDQPWPWPAATGGA